MSRGTDPRYQRKPKTRSKGYEPGSVMSRMSTQEQTAFRRWLEEKARDARAFERSLR